MTRPLRTAASAALASALFATLLVPMPAVAGPQEQAVAQCRADLLGRFPDGSIHNYRVAEISGNSRGTRVRIIVSADRRYSYECRAGGDGRIISATFDPPRDDRLAAGQR